MKWHKDRITGGAYFTFASQMAAGIKAVTSYRYVPTERSRTSVFGIGGKHRSPHIPTDL